MINMLDSSLMLKGNIIYLRPLILKDVNENYLSWLQDNEVMAGIATSGYTLEKLREYVKEKTTSPTTSFFAICVLGSDEHIGNIKLDFHDRLANVSELGLLIGNKNYWGKGVGFESCNLLLKFGFDQLKLRKIYLAVYGNNTNAIRLYEKVGFRTEGILRKHVCVDGDYHDKYLMGIFKQDFAL